MDKNLIKVSSTLLAEGENKLENIIDNDVNTLFLSTSYMVYPKNIYFELATEKVVDRIDFFNNNPESDAGKILKFEILYKNETSAKDWRSIYLSQSYDTKGIRIAKFEPILAKHICLRIHESTSRRVAINNIEIYTREDLETKLLELFENINCKNIIKDKTLKDITNYKYENKEFKFIGELCEVGKYTLLNGEIENIKNIKIITGESLISSDKFFTGLRSNKPLFLKPLEVFLKKQQDLIVLVDKPVDLYLIENLNKNIKSKKIRLGEGLNVLYSKDLSGELYLINNKADVNICVYNPILKKHFKRGRNIYSDIVKGDLNIEKVLIEGKTFCAQINRDYLIKEFKEAEFVQAIENLDTVYDYIYFLLDKKEVFRSSPFVFKRLLIEGELNDIKPTYVKNEYGSYINFAGKFEKFFNKEIQNLINDDFCPVVADEIFSEDILGGDVKNIFKFLLEKELEIRFLRKSSSTADEGLSIWYQLRLAYGSDRFISKLIRNVSEPTIDNLILVAAKILERDISIYFKDKYNISAETLEVCNSYPIYHIDINTLTFDTYKVAMLQERERFNEIILGGNL